MAAKKTVKKSSSTTDFSQIAKNVSAISLEREVETSFLSYAYMVILSRAIPDARDGMKPVHRRILWSMFEDGYTPEKNHVKSAKIVGAVTGNYHTFGDSACYEAMVRLAQDYSLSVPLIDGHGNFGGEPGGAAAAARYTEARLSKEALLLLQEIKDNGIDMKPNYDYSKNEPVVLPVKYPNLLINGGSGIAVGMASKMPTHSPDEIMDAARWLLTHPTASVEKLMEFVPGPDFPTGGEIIGADEIKSAYTEGRGTIKIRAKYRVEPLPRGKSQIVFYELPYEKSIEGIIDQIKKALKQNKLMGIADVKDLTDRKHGTRLTIETKAGVNTKVVVAELLKTTDLEISFGINNVAIVDGEPRTLGLKEMLEIFLAHRVDIITRKSQFRKEKHEAKMHLLTGLMKVLLKIDDAIKIIRASENPSVAAENLMKKFKIDEDQAKYVLAISLSRLTRFDQLELQKEKDKLAAELKELNAILTDESVMKKVLGKELEETKKAISRPRRSTILDGDLASHVAAVKELTENATAEIADEDCFITLTNKGMISRVGKSSSSPWSVAKSTTRGKFIAVTNKGRGFRLESIHVGTRAAAVSGVLPEKLAKGERVIAVTPTDLPEGGTGGIAMGTRNGVVKVVAPQWPVRSDDFSVINLDADDEILAARWVDDVKAADFVFVSSDSSLLTFSAEKVRPQGLSGSGMAGIKLADGQKAISFSVVTAAEKDKTMVTTYTGQTIKTSAYKEFPAKGRATGGVRSHKFLKGESSLRLASVSVGGVLYASDGKEVPLPKPSKRDASGTKFEDETIF